MSWYVITSLCHACYISEYIYLHIFRVSVLLKRNHSRGHRISCLAHHLERTDNNPFSRSIGPTHTNKYGNFRLKLVGEVLLLHSAIWGKQRYSTPQYLVCKRTRNVFAKLAKWLTCVVTTYSYGIHLNFRYRGFFEEGVPWHSGN